MSAPVFVADLNLEPVLVLEPRCTIKEAARALAATDTGIALVETTPTSEVTEHDVAVVVGAGLPVETALARLVLPPPCFVAPSTRLADATTMMIVTGRRAVVVADEQRPLGVIRLADAIATQLQGSTWTGALGHALHMEERP